MNKLKIVFEKWVFKDCLDTWPPRRVKKTFINRESSYFVEDVEILLIKIQMTDTILKPAAKFAKEILEIDNLDIASDNSFIHPPFLCRRCVAKIQRFKKSKNKNHPKFPGDQGKYCVFKTHNEYLVSEGTCYICSHSQRQSPRKRLGVALEENKSISEGKKARKQLFEVRPSEAGPSSSSQKTVIDHEPRTDTKSLNNV